MNKKIIQSVITICFMFSLLSCISLPSSVPLPSFLPIRQQYSSWQEYPPIPFFWQYEVNNISVVIDHVREDNIAKQLSVIAETHLDSRQNFTRESGKVLFLDFTVEQRSFMRNVRMYNTLFVSCIARDENGIIYARENEYITGKQTFISATEQNAVITRILNRLLKTQQVRYREIQRYEKNRRG